MTAVHTHQRSGGCTGGSHPHVPSCDPSQRYGSLDLKDSVHVHQCLKLIKNERKEGTLVCRPLKLQSSIPYNQTLTTSTITAVQFLSRKSVDLRYSKMYDAPPPPSLHQSNIFMLMASIAFQKAEIDSNWQKSIQNDFNPLYDHDRNTIV